MVISVTVNVNLNHTVMMRCTAVCAAHEFIVETEATSVTLLTLVDIKICKQEINSLSCIFKTPV